MPAFVCKTRVREVSDDCSLALDVRHRLVAGDSASGQAPFNLKTTQLEKIDVFATSAIVLTVSGTLNGLQQGSSDIVQSFLAKHLVTYLRRNATALGLTSVSGCLLHDSKTPTVILIPSHQCVRPQMVQPHLILVALDLLYAWKVRESECSGTTDCYEDNTSLSYPFAQQLALPFKILLDKVLGRCVTWNIVRRYPLIFGPWSQQLALEANYFPSITTSVMRIIDRSPNEDFRSRCRSLLEKMHQQHRRSSNILSLTFPPADRSVDESDIIPNDLSDDDVLHFRLRQIYQLGLRRPIFKGTSERNVEASDDDVLSRDLSQESPLELGPGDNIVPFWINSLSSNKAQRQVESTGFAGVDFPFVIADNAAGLIEELLDLDMLHPDLDKKPKLIFDIDHTHPANCLSEQIQGYRETTRRAVSPALPFWREPEFQEWLEMVSDELDNDREARRTPFSPSFPGLQTTGLVHDGYFSQDDLAIATPNRLGSKDSTELKGDLPKYASEPPCYLRVPEAAGTFSGMKDLFLNNEHWTPWHSQIAIEDVFNGVDDAVSNIAYFHDRCKASWSFSTEDNFGPPLLSSSLRVTCRYPESPDDHRDDEQGGSGEKEALSRLLSNGAFDSHSMTTEWADLTVIEFD